MFLLDVPIPDNNDSSSDSVAIIGGVVGGVILLLMIIVVLCIVILCRRRSCRKESSGTILVNSKLTNNMIKLTNSIYAVTKANTIDRIYSSIKPVKCSISKTSEEQSNYTQPNEHDRYSDLDETINKTNDPAYAGNAAHMYVEVDLECGANTGGVKTATDPAHTKMDNDLTSEVSMYAGKDREIAFNGTAAISAAAKQYDKNYVVLCNDHLSLNTVASSNDTTQNDGLLTHTTVNQVHGTKTNHPSHSATVAKPTEYGVINQPRSDDPNYDTDKPTDEAVYGIINQPLS